MKLVIHISSDSVTAGFVSTVANKPNLVASVTCPKLSPALHDLFSKKDGKGGKVTSVLCSIGSPWATTRGKTISIRQDRAFILTEKFLRGVMDVELKNFTKENTTEDTDAMMSVLEHAIIGAKIRGYDMPDPTGQTTDQCDLSFFISYSDQRLLVEITSAIHDITGISPDKIVFHSASFVSFSNIRTMFHPVEAAHIIVSNELTDVQIISGGLLKDTISFPCGSTVFAQRTARLLDVPIRVAQSMLAVYAAGRASDGLKEKITHDIAESGQEWLAYIESAALPPKIFLTCDTDTRSIFSGFLEHKNHMVIPIDADLLTESLFV